MPGKSKALLILMISVMLVTSYMGVTYACFGSPDYDRLFDWIDLKIKDQNEPWKDGVSATWTARNMAPGQEFAFTDSYVGLKSQSLKVNTPGKIDITCKYNAWSSRAPDTMAVYMDITRCVYVYKYLTQTWQIDCLTGVRTRLSPSGTPSSPNTAWKVTDADRDGCITFHDLKMRPLVGVPIYSCSEARFDLSVRFDKAAGDNLQKSVFNLTMVYSLTSQ
jgi:hypothetical protein